MAAVYTAITEQQIIYSTIPASFEEYGQRIRLTDSVLAQKLGTCLDMALLYASCLEAIGLNALLITPGDTPLQVLGWCPKLFRTLQLMMFRY